MVSSLDPWCALCVRSVARLGSRWPRRAASPSRCHGHGPSLWSAVMERSWVLTDAASGLWVETLDLGPEQLGIPAAPCASGACAADCATVWT